MKRLLIVLALALLVIPATAFASAVLDFRTGGSTPSGGSLIISGANASGSGILIDALNVTGSLHDGSYNVDGLQSNYGILDFDTSTGAITISGSVQTLVTNSPLLTGTITGFSILLNDGRVGGVYISGTDFKDSALLTSLGISTTAQFGFVGSVFGYNLLQTGSPYIVESTDILNTDVPEPATLLLLGTGMAVLGAWRLRKRS